MQDEISGEATATTLVAVVRTAPWPVTTDAVRARALDKLEQHIIGAHYSTKLPMDAAKGRVAAAIVPFSNVFVNSAPYLDVIALKRIILQAAHARIDACFDSDFSSC
jgi:hypothetical protein